MWLGPEVPPWTWDWTVRARVAKLTRATRVRKGPVCPRVSPAAPGSLSLPEQTGSCRPQEERRGRVHWCARLI